GLPPDVSTDSRTRRFRPPQDEQRRAGPTTGRCTSPPRPPPRPPKSPPTRPGPPPDRGSRIRRCRPSSRVRGGRLQPTRYPDGASSSRRSSSRVSRFDGSSDGPDLDADGIGTSSPRAPATPHRHRRVGELEVLG